MNDERFLRFQSSIDEDLLEEAQNYHKQKVSWGRYAALAACFCAVIAGVLAWHPWRPLYKTAAVMSSGAAADTAVEFGVAESTYAAPEAALYDFSESNEEMAIAGSGLYEEEADAYYSKQEDSEMAFSAAAEEPEESFADMGASAAMPNPIRECTLEDIAEMGYSITLPENSQILFCAAIDDLAEVSFAYDGSEYLLRALKTAQSEDISGVYDSVREAFSWSDAATVYEIREGSEGIVFSWYSSKEGTQWCLWTRDCGPEALIKTAGEIRGAEIPVPVQ